MSEAQGPGALLACPRCDRTPLEPLERGYRCAGCKVDFPLLDGIPWLFAEPAAAVGEWRGRLHFALRRLDHEQAGVRRALERPGIRASTRKRLERLRDAVAGQSERLRRLLAPLDVDAPTAAYETYLALRTRPPSDQGLLTYQANLHRDWAWGDDENRASLALVRTALGATAPGKTLVLGAGGGRLAYDIHQTLAPDVTFALDFNPLLLLVAARVTRGETVELYEFPLAPKDAEGHAVLRRLGVDVPARAGFELVLADAHRPPFAKGAFDTIVTPWLVDILPEPLDDLAARINHLLADGGRWVNFGSLSFHDADPALHYPLDECSEVLVENGFSAPEAREERIPYLASPASRHARSEEIVVWRADKQRRVKRPPRHEALPDWIVRGNEPVPLSASFRSQITATRIHAYIMSLIDGKRSLKDIARILAEQRLMTADEAEPALRSFLIRMYEDARRQRAY
ncbi:MAG TPA: class I SAM-dependent methyltransferase [Gammaproteobacteria bacterium]